MIREIFAQGLSASSKQNAFDRVNAFIAQVTEANSDMPEVPDIETTSDVKLDKRGRKIRANRINFGKKTVEEAKTPAWSRKEGKNPEGGLNRKGIASYRRENPGSKLSMAVTTPPSKLDPDSKAAKRRKSFCARMSGVDGPMKKPNGEPTRKALSLKKWNC